MRSSRTALCVLVLVLALASSTFAGEMQHPVAPPTPPTTNGEMQHPLTSTGEMHTGKSDSALGTDAVTEIALSLLQSVLSLL